jgi:formate dehydrogenase iron-sulfur subunit
VDIGDDGKAHKCTLCYDRLQHGLEPACAQACPTDSIRFGDVDELMTIAGERVAALRALGIDAYVYGGEEPVAMKEGDALNLSGVGSLNCFFVLVDEPEVYGLPRRPELPSENTATGFALSAATAGALAVAGVVSFRKERMDAMAATDGEGVPPGGGGDA